MNKYSDYIIIRSKRKTISLSIDDRCRVVVKAPMQMANRDIDGFVRRHKGWLDRHMPSARDRMRSESELTQQRINELIKEAQRIIPPRVEHFASIMEVKPTGVKITKARKRFGSCSGKNSLCFSCLLAQYPLELIDCAVVHELAHIRHHNHSAEFYEFIIRFMPDYRERERRLKCGPEIK